MQFICIKLNWKSNKSHNKSYDNPQRQQNIITVHSYLMHWIVNQWKWHTLSMCMHRIMTKRFKRKNCLGKIKSFGSLLFTHFVIFSQNVFVTFDNGIVDASQMHGYFIWMRICIEHIWHKLMLKMNYLFIEGGGLSANLWIWNKMLANKVLSLHHLSHTLYIHVG